MCQSHTTTHLIHIHTRYLTAALPKLLENKIAIQRQRVDTDIARKRQTDVGNEDAGEEIERVLREMMI